MKAPSTATHEVQADSFYNHQNLDGCKFGRRSEDEAKIGGMTGKMPKAELTVKEGKEVSHRLALTQDAISKMISVLRSAQQRMEPVSTRIPLDLKERLAAKAEELGKTQAEYLRDLIEHEVS